MIIKHSLTIALLSLVISCLSSQEIVFSYDYWQDPEVFEINQTQPHARIIPFSTTEDALTFDKSLSSGYMSLNGEWRFLHVLHPRLVPEGFWEPGYDTGDWDDITVPSHWELEGHGHPKFRNVRMTIETKPPFVPDYYNPAGCYKRSFHIPGDWNEKEVFLRFEGVKSASCVWINGKPAGYNQGGFEPAEYNITPYLLPGENEIAVKVLRYSDGAFLENQDMWRISGIFRSVALIAKPKVTIYDYYVATLFDDDYIDANLNVDIDILNLSGSGKAGYTAEINLLDIDHKAVFPAPVAKDIGSLENGIKGKVMFSVPVSHPLQWSAEKPNLYILEMSLRDGDGNLVEAVARRIGFRQTEIKDGAIWVNGKMVKLNGVNSHMHHPDHGQAVPVETLREDLLIMKQFNINCSRTSHYPPSPEYLDLADEIGIYIICEAGTECHDNEYLSKDPAWKGKFVDRGVKMVYRDRNHPSVIFWSAGNEAGEGDNLKALIDACRKIDPGRPWMYGGNEFYIPFEDIVGPRYRIPLQVKNLAEGKVLPDCDQRPSFMDEYLSAAGNSLGGLDEYWELIWNYPRLSGGAIWDWVSPAVNTPLWILPDLSPARNDGVIMGRPEFVEGMDGGRGLEFSGHDDWIEFYRDPVLDITGSLSVGIRIKPLQIPEPNMFITKGNYQFGIIMENPDVLEFYIHSGRRISARAMVDGDWYGEWHNVAGIYDGRSLKLYIDEELVAETFHEGKIDNTPFPLCIGRQADTQDQGQYTGRLSKMVIDRVRIFDRAVSLAELQNNLSGAVLALDFENDRMEGNFPAVGLGGRTYGIIWADRTIQPEIYQIKKSGQPVKAEAVDIERGQIRIINRHHFTNLNELDVSWQLISGRDTVKKEGMIIDLPAGDSKVISLPGWSHPGNKQNSDKVLLLSFRLKNSTSWAERGHEVAWEQFELPAINVKDDGTASGGNINLIENESKIAVDGKNFTYTFDKTTGNLVSLKIEGKELLERGPEYSVWRAPLANDIDPWGSYEFQARNYTPGFGRSIDNQLRTLGMDRLVSEADRVEVTQNGNSEVEISIRSFSYAYGRQDRRQVMYYTDTPTSAFERNEKWTIYPDGQIGIELEIIPHGLMPDMLQRSGLEFILPRQFRNVEWYGRGPFENYPDRKTGARTGLYKSDADEMYVPYVIPQDYGNRSDVRWVRVTDDSGKGLLFSSDKFINFRLHKYDTDHLDRAFYTYQLRESHHVTLNIDFEVTGVGETSTRQMQKYRVRPDVKRYRLFMRPVI